MDITEKGSETRKNQRGAAALFWGGMFFTVIVMLWPILMVISEVQGTVDEQLLQILQTPRLYMANFLVASLIAPALLFLMLTFAFAVETRMRIPLFEQIGAVFLTVYTALVSIAYTSQYAYLPRLLAAGEMEQARLWLFSSNVSLPYYLNQLGYACFAVAALLIGFKLLYETGIPRIIGTLLWASALLSLLAFGGLALQLEAQGIASVMSGLLTLPVGILSIFWGKKLLRDIITTKQ